MPQPIEGGLFNILRNDKDNDSREVIATIQIIKQYSGDLEKLGDDLPEALRQRAGVKQTALAVVGPHVPQFLKQWISFPDGSISQLGITEGNLREKYNSLAIHLERTHTITSGRVVRHEQLLDIYEQAKTGKISLTDIGNQMHRSVVSGAGFKRIPLVEQLIEESIMKLSADQTKRREIETLEELETILAQTGPVVEVSGVALRAGALTLDKVARAHFVISEVRQPLEMLDQLPRDLLEATGQVIIVPELIKYEVRRAVDGLRIALNGVELANGLSNKGTRVSLQLLSSQAKELEAGMNATTAPPPPHEQP